MIWQFVAVKRAAARGNFEGIRDWYVANHRFRDLAWHYVLVSRVRDGLPITNFTAIMIASNEAWWVGSRASIAVLLTHGLFWLIRR